MKQQFKRAIRRLVFKLIPELNTLKNNNYKWSFIERSVYNSVEEENTKIYNPSHIINSKIGRFTYISQNAYINNTSIGRFCSIGPNLICGWGSHPINGISTHPSFYSTKKQCGVTFSKIDKIDEVPPIKIGNDVFIGANVTILNGVTINDGAIIGAGAVVSKDIPPYAIATGVPIKINKYRFDEGKIEKLQKLEWWNFDKNKLQLIEKYFYDIDSFIKHL